MKFDDYKRIDILGWDWLLLIDFSVFEWYIRILGGLPRKILRCFPEDTSKEFLEESSDEFLEDKLTDMLKASPDKSFDKF